LTVPTRSKSFVPSRNRGRVGADFSADLPSRPESGALAVAFSDGNDACSIAKSDRTIPASVTLAKTWPSFRLQTLVVENIELPSPRG
ncbi:MAG: hypothetical protein WBH86_12850, partial [Thermogutta sp.]